MATVYQKHKTLLTQQRTYKVWRLPGACTWIGFVNLEEGELWIEAQVNGSCNSNGLKVAKFLVGSLPTRMNGVTFVPLSPLEPQWNWISGADAGTPWLDEKTLEPLLEAYTKCRNILMQTRWECSHVYMYARRWETTWNFCTFSLF